MLRQSLIVGTAVLLTGGAAIAANLELRPGGRATVTLVENGSTGYAWRIDESASQNPGVLRLEDKGYAPPAKAAPLGAPGSHTWAVEALAKGHARIEFVYKRPWESTPVKRETWSVDVL